MILIGRYLSPFVRRVGISLQLLDIPFERKELSTQEDFDELVKINPLGRVPALILDNGDVLIDSSTMLDYIDELAGPERALIPHKGVARQRVMNKLGIIQGISDKTLALNVERRIHPENERNQAWMQRCEIQINNGLGALEAGAETPWLVGENATQADITLLCIWDMLARILPDTLKPAAYPKLHEIIARCNELPAVTSTRFAAS